MVFPRPVRYAAASLLWAVVGVAHGFTTNFAGSPAEIYLQVGQGNGRYAVGVGSGALGNNNTVQNVSVTVPAGSVGTGPLAMTTNSTATRSAYDNFVFCDIPAEVYVGGYVRAGNGRTGRLQATAPANLTDGANTIPFDTISWISGGNGDTTPTIPSNTFIAGGTRLLYTVPANTFFESCLAFRYANSTMMPSGTFTGRVRFDLTTP